MPQHRTGLAVAILALLSVTAAADVPVQTVVTVHLLKDGAPYHKPADFTVRCFGWRVFPGQPGFDQVKPPTPYTPQEIYSYSASCPDYGCTVRHSLYLNYKHIDYCNVEGRTDGRTFKIEKFGTNPVGTCGNPGRSTSSNAPLACELKLTLPR